MTVHDDARTAFEKVYDDAITASATAGAASRDAEVAGLQSALTAANGQVSTLTGQLSTLQGQFDAYKASHPTVAPLWGAAAQQLAGESWQQAFDRSQATMGKFQIARTYDNGGGPAKALTIASGVNIWPKIISFKLDPAAVTVGTHDAELAAFFADTRVTYWSYYHECDQAGRPFTPAQFVAAWRHIFDLSQKSANKGLIATLILTGYQVVSRFPNFWPGDGYVDVFAVDPYIGKTTDTAQSISQDAYSLARQHGVRFGIAETGVQTDTFTTAQDVAGIQSMAWWADKCEFVCYFDVKDGTSTHSRIDDIPDAAAAWRTLTTQN